MLTTVFRRSAPLALALLAGAVFAQDAQDYAHPRTEWGVPDVQGVWNFKTRTTLERPEIYEGDSLVVVTRDFHPWQVAKERLTSRNLTLTERFTQVADGKLHYAFEIDDPELYSQPWRGELPMYTGEELYEYACHEGNYSLRAILAGARTLEVNPSEPGEAEQ